MMLDEYDHKLHKINRGLANLQGESRDQAELNTHPPLSQRILKEPILGRFKMPQFEP